jgi:hypothetical protein
MELAVKRTDANGVRTIGLFFIDGLNYCWTLEDAIREGPKIHGKTAIPPGRYRVIINHSQRFNRDMPLLCNVPGFEGIRIHTGNTDANTDGCILVGEARGDNAIFKSRAAFDPLFQRLKAAIGRKEQIWITITNPSKGSVPGVPAAA